MTYIPDIELKLKPGSSRCVLTKILYAFNNAYDLCCYYTHDSACFVELDTLIVLGMAFALWWFPCGLSGVSFTTLCYFAALYFEKIFIITILHDPAKIFWTTSSSICISFSAPFTNCLTRFAQRARSRTSSWSVTFFSTLDYLRPSKRKSTTRTSSRDRSSFSHSIFSFLTTDRLAVRVRQVLHREQVYDRQTVRLCEYIQGNERLLRLFVATHNEHFIFDALRVMRASWTLSGRATFSRC